MLAANLFERGQVCKFESFETASAAAGTSRREFHDPWFRLSLRQNWNEGKGAWNLRCCAFLPDVLLKAAKQGTTPPRIQQGGLEERRSFFMHWKGYFNTVKRALQEILHCHCTRNSSPTSHYTQHFPQPGLCITEASPCLQITSNTNFLIFHNPSPSSFTRSTRYSPPTRYLGPSGSFPLPGGQCCAIA